MKFSPKLNLAIEGETFSYKVFESLKCISKTFSQREAAKHLGISHAVLNRRIKKAEEKLGFKLVVGTGAGSGLTPSGEELMEKYERFMSRLKEREKPVICGGYISTGLMDVLCRDYGLDAVILSTDDESALRMAEMDMVDLLTLDDPVHAFLRDLDLIPIGYDHLALVPGSEECPKSVNDLEGKKFVEVEHSIQRLAWNTLDHLKIDYKIVDVCRSPHNALKAVKDGDDLYTFINRSLNPGSDILAEDTRHIISMIPATDQEDLIDFVEFVTGRGQNIVEKWGLEAVKSI